MAGAAGRAGVARLLAVVADACAVTPAEPIEALANMCGVEIAAVALGADVPAPAFPARVGGPPRRGPARRSRHITVVAVPLAVRRVLRGRVGHGFISGEDLAPVQIVVVLDAFAARSARAHSLTTSEVGIIRAFAQHKSDVRLAAGGRRALGAAKTATPARCMPVLALGFIAVELAAPIATVPNKGGRRGGRPSWVGGGVGRWF